MRRVTTTLFLGMLLGAQGGLGGCAPKNDPPGGATVATQHEYIKDLKFSHRRHEEHEGAPESCAGCHKQGRLRRPMMLYCADCHAREEVVTLTGTMDNCGLCHEQIRKGQEPKWPYHYGKRGHQVYVARPVVYCAYCHDKNPSLFPIKERYEEREICLGCHQSEQLGLPGGA